MTDETDPRIISARQYHHAALLHERIADHRRVRRDQLVRELKDEGWTNTGLAAAIGCTEGNIRHILKGDKSK